MGHDTMWVLTWGVDEASHGHLRLGMWSHEEQCVCIYQGLLGQQGHTRTSNIAMATPCLIVY
jgi:hypothetical protein